MTSLISADQARDWMYSCYSKQEVEPILEELFEKLQKKIENSAKEGSNYTSVQHALDTRLHKIVASKVCTVLKTLGYDYAIDTYSSNYDTALEIYLWW